MEDFYFAGGLRALLAQLLDLLHGEALTVTGQTLRDNLQAPRCTTPKSSARAPTRFPRKAAPRSCSATFAPTAR